ncbi:hypothetical protein BY996DRAFT_6480478 [Phakopsora pachyrhizi]|nr:hypothetical protein BY996DRAFT_6480478 [Phakopsora pachyrhizi]
MRKYSKKNAFFLGSVSDDHRDHLGVRTRRKKKKKKKRMRRNTMMIYMIYSEADEETSVESLYRLKFETDFALPKNAARGENRIEYLDRLHKPQAGVQPGVVVGMHPAIGSILIVIRITNDDWARRFEGDDCWMFLVIGMILVGLLPISVEEVFNLGEDFSWVSSSIPKLGTWKGFSTETRKLRSWFEKLELKFLMKTSTLKNARRRSTLFQLFLLAKILQRWETIDGVRWHQC